MGAFAALDSKHCPLLTHPRREGDGLVETSLSGDVRPRHVVGVVPCPRSHVLPKIPSEKSRLSRSCPELST